MLQQILQNPQLCSTTQSNIEDYYDLVEECNTADAAGLLRQDEQELDAEFEEDLDKFRR